MLRVVVLSLWVMVLSGAQAQPLWGDARVGMSESEVLATVPGAVLLPEEARESDLFGTAWSVSQHGVEVRDLLGTATFGFDDAALRVVKLEFASPLAGLAADVQCASLLGALSERHGAPGATERHSSLGIAFTQATWIDGPLVVVAMCMGGAQGTTFFVGIRPLTPRELEVRRAG
jgi:hypothetical protein